MSPRLARSRLLTFDYFHICARGNNGQAVFADDKDRLRYLGLLEKYRLKFQLQYLAYCLMTNHVHLLLVSPSIQTLSKSMHAIHVAYVMYFNRRHERRGHLFQDRFVSWVIKGGDHLLEAKEYIENNPVKSHMVTTKEDYPWSSANRDGSYLTLHEIKG